MFYDARMKLFNLQESNYVEQNFVSLTQERMYWLFKSRIVEQDFVFYDARMNILAQENACMNILAP